MTDPTIFGDAQQVIGRRWSKNQPKEKERILGLARDAMVFISATGQHYPFLDFRAGNGPHVSWVDEDGSVELRTRLHETERFFKALLDDPAAVEEQAAIRTILDALRFTCSMRQVKALGEFICHEEANAPPWIVAVFDKKEQAERWLKTHPDPPYCANVLIENKYHHVAYDRETNFRRLPWNHSMEHYLGWLERDDPPVAQVSFDSLEQAEAWLRSQPNPPLRTWVLIAGEFYLAVHHTNVHHRALYPLSMAIRPPEEDEEVPEDSTR